MSGVLTRSLFFGCLGVVSGGCLPNRVPEEDRLHLDDSQTVRLLVYNWPSAETVTSIADILIREVLGVHSVMNETIDTILEAALKLAGCRAAECAETTAPAHAALETWMNSGAEWVEFRDLHPDRAPVDLGSIGYQAEDGLFVSKTTIARAYDETGNSLDFYRAYNQSHHGNVHRYFTRLVDLQVEDFLGCNESKWVKPAFINPYVQYTGDLQGVIEVAAGQYHARCHDGKFWVAPSCRDSTECIPVVTGGYGWLLQAVMTWSTAYGMPTALGIARSPGHYAKSILTAKVMYYWWRPDVTFRQLNPEMVIFPRHDAEAWAQGDQRTASLGSKIGKLVNAHLDAIGGAASRVFQFLENLEISLQDIEGLLARQSNGDSVKDTACDWVTSNQAKWDSWIPVRTTCGPGFGLINRSLSYVSSRAQAVDCGLCVPGRFSEAVLDSAGRTRRCSVCTAGYAQHLAGETSCVKCEVGRAMAELGQSHCRLCPLGSYANATGMTSCERCGDGLEWTTSRLVKLGPSQGEGEDSGKRWIEIEGAGSVDLCNCIPGWHLQKKICRKCSAGTQCLGGELQVLPGYFSSEENPGNVFKCLDADGRCPGGVPGTCAQGRDASSRNCGRCLPGLRARGGAECLPCNGADYLVLALLGILFCSSSGILHLASLNTSQTRRQTSLINAVVSLNQLVTCLQLLAIMGQLDISWGDPFLSLLRMISFMSPEYLWEQLAISCVMRLSPVSSFLLQNLAVPALLCVVPALVHFIDCLRHREPKLHLLLGTLGLLCVLFVPVSCYSILEPFQCEQHPNGLFTMRSKQDVLCNFSGIHLELCVIGWTLSLFPILFLALCSWILMELPKRLQVSDMKFLHACSFLILRFRPGSASFALVFLVRNMLFAFTPVLPGGAASLLMMHTIMSFSFGLVAYCQPWPTRLSTCMDLCMHLALLLTLVFGAFHLHLENSFATMVICTLVTLLMMLGIFAMAVEGVGRYLVSRIVKPYHFFLCHHKGGAGNLARWLKMELSRRSKKKVFIDSDNLTDLTRLFTIVTQEVQTLVIIASPETLSRKWCVGEIVAARLGGVRSVLLTLPNFALPDHHVLHAFEGLRGSRDLRELASYGFGKTEVMDTMKWLSTIQHIHLETVSLAAFIDVVAALVKSRHQSDQSGNSHETRCSNCLILADLKDTEAVATAHILRMLIGSDMMHIHGAFPEILDAGDSITERLIPSMPDLYLAMICTQDCLASCEMATWILEALDWSDDQASGSMSPATTQTLPLKQQVFVLPLLADDFQVPCGRSLEKCLQNPGLRTVDKARYAKTLRAIFLQIAISFAPKVSSEGDLQGKARQITSRLQPERMGSLHTNFALGGAAWGSESPCVHFGSQTASYELCSEFTEETLEWAF